MPMTFRDRSNRDWRVEWDGLLLDDVRTQTTIDLADLSGGGLAIIETDAPKLVKVLAVLLREQIAGAKLSNEQFSKAIRGDVLTSAFAAVLEAAADFFPQDTWSGIQRHLTSQRTFRTNWIKVKPLLAKLNEPEMESLRPAVLQALTEMMGGIDGQQLQELMSATGQVATPSPPVTSSPEKLESTPAA